MTLTWHASERKLFGKTWRTCKMSMIRILVHPPPSPPLPSPTLPFLLSFPFPNVFFFFYSAAGIRLSQPLSEFYTSRNPTLEVRHQVHLQLGTRAVLRVCFASQVASSPKCISPPLKGTRPFLFPSLLSCVNSLAPLTLSRCSFLFWNNN